MKALIALFTVTMTCFALSGCPGGGMGSEGLSIVPPIGAAPVQYCNRDASGLIVTFQNTGQAAAPASDVTVTFFVNGVGTANTMPRPAVTPSSTVNVTFPIPSGCFGPDCNFSISWPESDTAVGGICIG